MVEFKLEVPSTYVLVDHSIFRAFNKGALAMLKVNGPDNKRVYSGKEVDETYLGEQAPEGYAAAQRVATLLGIKYKRDQSDGFLHSNVITVLNKAGEMVHRHEGLQQDMASTLAAIRQAVQD